MTYRLLMLVTTIPLVIYPAVFMACVMGLAAPASQHANPLVVLAANGFLWASLLYPIGYIAGFASGFRLITAAHLALCVLLLVAWLMLDRLVRS